LLDGVRVAGVIIDNIFKVVKAVKIDLDKVQGDTVGIYPDDFALHGQTKMTGAAAQGQREIAGLAKLVASYPEDGNASDAQVFSRTLIVAYIIKNDIGGRLKGHSGIFSPFFTHPDLL
jgi:hypothetical protein